AAKLDLEAVAPVDEKVDGQADAEIAAQGRIHGNEHDLHPVLQGHVGPDDPVEDRLAVFMLADLEEGRIGRRLDEIAGGIELEQPHAAALDLPAEEHRDVEGYVLGLHGL